MCTSGRPDKGVEKTQAQAVSKSAEDSLYCVPYDIWLEPINAAPITHESFDTLVTVPTSLLMMKNIGIWYETRP